VTVLTLTGALVCIKALVILLLARLFGLRAGNAIAMALLLSQGGEFAFVLFSLSSAAGLFDHKVSELLILVVTLSMVVTPFLYMLQSRLFQRAKTTERPFDVPEIESQHVVIAGFGRFGQIIGRMLATKHIPFTALEISATQVDFVRRFGNKIYYGDATRLDILRTAELSEARALVIAVDDVEAAVKIAEIAKAHFPDVPVFARARNRVHAFRLMDAGVKGQIRDTLLSSVQLGTELLQSLGLTPAQAQDVAKMFRQHDEQALKNQYEVAGDEQALIQSAKDSAKQLRELFESDTRAE
jgi:voltage-gated potassium channel Kch